MSRLSSFVAGMLTGGVAYAGMSLYTQAEIDKVDTKLRALYLDLAGESARSSEILNSKKQRSGILQSSGLAEFKEKASASFRHNWNKLIRQGYTSVQSLFSRGSSTTTTSESKASDN